MTPEEFKNLKDGTKLFWRKGETSEHRGVLSSDGDVLRVHWDGAGTPALLISKIGEYKDWLTNITLDEPGPPTVKLIGVKIPDGYELTGEFRFPKAKEFWLHSNGTSVCSSEADGDQPRLILRKLTPDWVAPKWMKPGCWLWSNDGRTWWLSDKKPDVTSVGVYSKTGSALLIVTEITKCSAVTNLGSIEFTPPPFTGRESSLRQIPDHAS